MKSQLKPLQIRLPTNDSLMETAPGTSINWLNGFNTNRSKESDVPILNLSVQPIRGAMNLTPLNMTLLQTSIDIALSTERDRKDFSSIMSQQGGGTTPKFSQRNALKPLASRSVADKTFLDNYLRSSIFAIAKTPKIQTGYSPGIF